MEALDPAHRSFEMHFESNGILNYRDFAGPMEFVFGEWIGALAKQGKAAATFVNANALNNVSNSHLALNTPFFVWMENHHFCVGQDCEEYLGVNGNDFQTRELNQSYTRHTVPSKKRALSKRLMKFIG
jgi:hypothetical protein